jgi:uncharacterized protein YhaN
MALTNSQIPLFNNPVQLEVRNQVLKIQGDEIKNTQGNLEILERDLNTQRRQVEIIQNSSLIKSNHIFILKTILSALALSIVPLILLKKQIIELTPFFISTGIIGLLVAVVLFYNLYSVYNRDPNRFNNRQFDPSNTMAPSHRPLKCVTNETKRLTKLQKEIKQKEEELDALEERIKMIDDEKQELIDKKRQNISRDKELVAQWKTAYPGYNLDTQLSKISGNSGLRDGKFSLGYGGKKL